MKTPPRNCRQTAIRRLSLAIGIIAISAADAAIACMCMAYPEDVKEAVALACTHADVVFLGKVTSMKRTRFQSLPARNVTFEILESWKGMSEDTLIAQVRTNIGEHA